MIILTIRNKVSIANHPPQILKNNGMKILDGSIINVATLTPKFVPKTTKSILKILLFHRSLKLFILPKLAMSLFLIFLYLASVNPENHPAASNGWIIVKGATINQTIADCIFDPDNIEPIKAVVPPIRTNSRRFP